VFKSRHEYPENNTVVFKKILRKNIKNLKNIRAPLKQYDVKTIESYHFVAFFKKISPKTQIGPGF